MKRADEKASELRVSADFERLFGGSAIRMREICRNIYGLEDVNKVVLYGSYAKGTAGPQSDVDIAVFFDCEDARLIGRYRLLARICVDEKIDVQVQPFHTYELVSPCGIIEEIVTYGIELLA